MADYPGIRKTGRRVQVPIRHQDQGSVSPPTRPYGEVGMDFAGPSNVPGQKSGYVLVVVDYCTRYVHFFTATRTAARCRIRTPESIESTLGRVGTVVTDNAPCFRDHALEEHLRRNGVKRRLGGSRWRSSDEGASRCVGGAFRSVGAGR